MAEIFDAVVRLLNAICRATGLSYYEINIMIYTFFIPASWWAIVWWRLKKWPWIWIIHLGVPLLYYFCRDRLIGLSEQFYDANTEALLWLGQNEATGYVQVSILVGIILPALIYLSLWLVPKRYLNAVYIGLIFGNLIWYGWTGYRSTAF